MPDSSASAPKVFCSHRSIDKIAVRDFARRLREQGIDAWVDGWEIAPGDDFVARIDEGLATCQAGLIFFSPATASGPWVTAEISALIVPRWVRARQRERRTSDRLRSWSDWRRRSRVAERLWAAEPGRADLAQDLAISVLETARLDPGESSALVRRAVQILRPLAAEGRLDVQGTRLLERALRLELTLDGDKS